MVRLGEYDTKKIQDCDEDDPDDPECADPVKYFNFISNFSNTNTLTRYKTSELHQSRFILVSEMAESQC